MEYRMSESRVALLGVGAMGGGMAANLLRGGFPLTVYNRNAERANAIREAGARVAASPREAAAEADVVISMVADDRASRAVWMGDEGALAGVRRDALLIESSTVTVEWVRELAQAAQAAGAEFIDAPVTGSKEHAAAAQMLFLVGGSAAALERARLVLSAMGRGVVHVGPTGSGALLKLVNNFMGGVQAANLAEALTLVERSGIDRKTALEVLLNGAPASPLVKTLAPRMTELEYSPPNFALKLMAKDLTYAREEAARRGVTLDTAACALAMYERAIAAGDGERDFAAIIEAKRAQPQ
jgi:3-hydroxyisobutyrate dehydrogenase